jgi:hypothetical protein
VVQRGEQVTVAVELDDVGQGKQLWGDRYKRKVADLLSIESDIANKKKMAKTADEGFLTTAAQAIGSTLGQLAVKTGVVAAPPAAVQERAIKKTAAVATGEAVTKKKAAVSKKKLRLNESNLFAWPAVEAILRFERERLSQDFAAAVRMVGETRINLELAALRNDPTSQHVQAQAKTMAHEKMVALDAHRREHGC